MLLQKLIELFNTWEVRLSVILSLLIQIFLILFGSRRKFSRAFWLRILVWGAYITSDAVAIFTLGVLAINSKESCQQQPLQNHQLQLIWVPFLILHLGGPDAITAYSLEDNKLWLRHLLNLVIQIGVAFYAVVNFWSNNHHNPVLYLVIPIFVWGVIKYLERIWALKSATLEQIHDRLSSEWEYCSSNATGIVSYKAYRFLSTLTYYFAYKLLPDEDRFYDNYGRAFRGMTPSDAFRLVENELVFVYDLLYTKALLIYSRWGICLRCVYLVSSLATLTSFFFTHKHNWAKWSDSYPLSDVLITYFLMVGAVILEVYAVILVVLSDWTLVWLSRCRHLDDLVEFLSEIIPICRRAVLSDKRWSGTLRQHNIIKSRITPARSCRDVFPISLLMNSELFDTSSVKIVDVAADFMKKRVFDVILGWCDLVEGDRLQNIEYSEFMKEIIESESPFIDHRGTTPVMRRIQFGASLYSWHIATTLLYYSDYDETQDDRRSGSRVRSYYRASRYLSEYLMYLVRFRQDMLPPGYHTHTYAPLVKFMDWCFDGFKNKRMDDACKRFLEKATKLDGFDTAVSTEELKAIEEIIGLALWLTGQLKRSSLEDRWKKISEVWVHFLVYAAACPHKWEEHAQQLRRGGEFITHVAILIVHVSHTKNPYHP